MHAVCMRLHGSKIEHRRAAFAVTLRFQGVTPPQRTPIRQCVGKRRNACSLLVQFAGLTQHFGKKLEQGALPEFTKIARLQRMLHRLIDRVHPAIWQHSPFLMRRAHGRPAPLQHHVAGGFVLAAGHHHGFIASTLQRGLEHKLPDERGAIAQAFT